MKKRICAFLLACCLLLTAFGNLHSLAAQTECPYCDYTLTEDGTLVHASGCNAEYAYDGSGDVGKYAKLIEEVGSYEVCDGTDYSDSMQFFYEEFAADTIMCITGWYWDSSTTGLWYAVSFYSGGVIEDVAEYWPETPWILHDYTDTAYEYDESLCFIDPCSVCGKPDCSSDHTNWCDICQKDDCGVDHTATEPTQCEICGETDCNCANEEPEVQETFVELMSAESLEEFEALMDALSDELRAKMESSSYWPKILVESYLHVYSHFYSTGTEEEFFAHAEKYPDAYEYIQADETLKYYNDKHLERIRYVAENPNEGSSVTLGEIVYITLPSYTDVAPKWANSTAAAEEEQSSFTLRAARVNSAAGAADPDGNGVGLSKTYDPTTGTIRLEAYSTGASVTTVTETELPADIILVLDLSRSMESDMDNVGYQALTGGTAEDVYQDYNGSLYVEVDGSYKEVTITGTNPTTTTGYTKYEEETSSGDHGPGGGSNYRARELYSYIEEDGGTLYYKASDGEYYEVQASRTESGGKGRYTIYYIDANGTTHNFVNKVDGDTTVNSTTYQLYTGGTVTVYESYTYTYTDADGQQVSNTYAPTDSVVSDNGPDYYVLAADGTTTTRAAALKNAVTTFASEVANKAKGADNTLGTTDDVAHNIAIVGFNGSGNGSTGVYIGSTIDTYSDDVADTTYQTALQDMSTDTGVDNVTASIGALENEQGTYTYCGTEMANGILAAYADDENRYVDSEGNTIRSKVVVIFTDGEPNAGSGYDAYDDPIKDAWEMKNTYGATVYTVGILDDGDTTIPPTTDLNKFMHYMSSNYKDAESLDEPGELTATNGGYYLLAANSNDLNDIFSSISSSATSGGSLTKLSTTTEVRDIISPYFTLPEGADASSIRLYTADYNGPGNWGVDTALTTATATIGDDGKKISITGFDFSENWVGEVKNDGVTTGYHGKKLIIEFPLVLDADFLGGSDVATNDAKSGVYDPVNSDAIVEKFDVPTTDVDLKAIETVVQDREIYLGNTIDLTDVLALYVLVSDTDDPLQVTADGINNAYVNLVYTVTLDDNTVYTYTIPAGTAWNDGTWTQGNTVVDMSTVRVTKNTDYGITCVMTDKSDSTSYQTASGTATIYVRMPQITFRDVEKVPNIDKVDYDSDNYVEVVWLDESNTVGTEGTAPTLTLTYTPATGCVATDGTVTSLTDFYVNAQVTTPDGTDITNLVDFEHSNCSQSGCSFDLNSGEFIIHVNTGTLVVKKVVTGSGADPDQEFSFTLTSDDAKFAGSYTYEITGGTSGTMSPVDQTLSFKLKAGQSITFYGLPTVAYTVTEDTSSLPEGFACAEPSKPVSLEKDTVAEVTVTNAFQQYSLTIKHQGAEPGQIFVYEVENTETHEIITVTVTGNGSTTIYELPQGEYTVTQKNNWSWRYGDADEGKTIQHESANSTVTFEQTWLDKWLGGCSTIIENIWGALTNVEI